MVKTGRVRKEWEEFKRLLRSIPCAVVALFSISVVLMNLMANKEIHTGVSWIVLDCGTLISWLSFLCMDIIVKRFGAKASIQISVFAAMINLMVCIVLLIVSKIPGNWAAYYNYGIQEVNTALNDTFGGTWYVLMGSTVAFITSSVVNAVLNVSIGSLIRYDNFKAFAIRSFVSTVVAQFVDNLVFTMIVSYVFFGWSIGQCLICAVTVCVWELVCEAIFSPIGYRISKSWELNNVGNEYLDSINS